jgi:hypothetical protein
MDSLRNLLRNKGGAPNLLGVTLGHRWEMFRREKSPNEESRTGQRVIYPGRWTCPMKGSDLFGGAPDRTSPVETRLIW